MKSLTSAEDCCFVSHMYLSGYNGVAVMIDYNG